MKYLIMTMALISTVLAMASGQQRLEDIPPFITGLNIPGGIAYDKEGILYIAEWGNHRVCCYDGNGTRAVVTDDVGDPSGIAFDQDDNLYVADYSGGVIYKLDRQGHKSIYARGFKVPAGIAFIDGLLYVPNRDEGEVLRIERDGSKTVVASGLPQPVAMLQVADKLVVSCLGGPIYTVDHLGKSQVLTPGMNRPDFRGDLILWEDRSWLMEVGFLLR